MPVIRYYKCGRCGRHMDELEAMVNLTPLCHNDDRDCYQEAALPLAVNKITQTIWEEEHPPLSSLIYSRWSEK